MKSMRKTMTERNFQNDRRRLLRGALMGIAVAPLAYVSVRGSNALAQDMPKLSEDDPTAIALNYVHDASTKDDMREANAVCSNCSLYLGESGEAWGGCTAFPNKLVNANGWCISWVSA
jgi:hypothetical protein